MALETKLLIVIDPTSDSHPAVDRVVNLLELGTSGYKPEITLLFAVDHSGTDTTASNPNIYRDEKFFMELMERLTQVGITPEIRISWSKDWADSILSTAEQVGATSLMVSRPNKTATIESAIEFWHLIRNTTIPVGIIQQAAKPRCETILASINIQDTSAEREALNTKIVRAGMMVAKTYGAQLHLANAYGTSSSYPDRGKLVSLTGLPNENIHLQAGEPEEAIADITHKLDPDVIIIGATHRRGIRAALRGRKMSRIFQAVNKDIFIIV